MDGRVVTLLEAHHKPLEPSMVSKSAVTSALAGLLCVGMVTGVPQPAVAAYSQTVPETQLEISISNNEELRTKLKVEIKAEIKAEMKARITAAVIEAVLAVGGTYATLSYVEDNFMEEIKVATAGIDPSLKSCELVFGLTTVMVTLLVDHYFPI
jgi:predicted MFS family arabinose efflux permease